MKTLNTLIRLQKDEVDKRKKELAEIEARKQKLVDEHTSLTEQLERESELATQFPEAASAFALFARKTIDRQKSLVKTIEVVQKTIDKKRDELQIEFGELKKYEIALDQYKERIFLEEKKRDAKLMDEVAIRGFSRKED
jgi:flagellar export protein FliJ